MRLISQMFFFCKLFFFLTISDPCFDSFTLSVRLLYSTVTGGDLSSRLTGSPAFWDDFGELGLFSGDSERVWSVSRSSTCSSSFISSLHCLQSLIFLTQHFKLRMKWTPFYMLLYVTHLSVYLFWCMLLLIIFNRGSHANQQPADEIMSALRFYL